MDFKSAELRCSESRFSSVAGSQSEQGGNHQCQVSSTSTSTSSTSLLYHPPSSPHPPLSRFGDTAPIPNHIQLLGLNFVMLGRSILRASNRAIARQSLGKSTVRPHPLTFTEEDNRFLESPLDHRRAPLLTFNSVPLPPLPAPRPPAPPSTSHSLLRLQLPPPPVPPHGTTTSMARRPSP